MINEWIDVNDRLPPHNIVVDGKLSHGTEKEVIYTENSQRACFLIKGSAGMFWRSMFVQVAYWRMKT